MKKAATGSWAYGGNMSTPKTWGNLSMKEKADIMKVAVQNGITNLQDIRDRYNDFAEGGDLTDDEYFSIMEKVAKENWKDWGDESEDAALVRILNDNSYDYRGYYNKYPESEANAETHWSDEFKTVYHPTFSDESIYSGNKSKFNPDGLIGGHWEGEHFIPAPWQEDENEYSSGGKIHIKPSHRGRFTELKKRTGHSASWFKAHGTPAQKKMAVFALNSKKWKHADGGPLVDTANAHIYDGTTEDSQQMNDNYIFTGKPSQYDFQVTAKAPTVYWDGFNWIGFNDLGQRVTKGSNFNPSGARIIENPQEFENARLAQARRADINGTHRFAEDIRNFTTDLVLMPAGDVLAEPIGILGGKVLKAAAKTKAGKAVMKGIEGIASKFTKGKPVTQAEALTDKIIINPMTKEEMDAAYKTAVESSNKQEAYRLLEEAYLNSGIPKNEITTTPEGGALGWFHGSEWGNHTVFDSSAMNATIGGNSAAGKIKGNFLTTDLPSAGRYAGIGSRYSSTPNQQITVPATWWEKVQDFFGKYKPRKLYPAERTEGMKPRPERLFDTEGKAPIEHLDKTDRVVYPMYVNPGENPMMLDFKGNPWSKSPVEFPNNFYLKRWVRDDVAKTYRNEIFPFKDLETAMEAWKKDPINVRHGSTDLGSQYFDDGVRYIEGFNSSPRYETVRLVEERVPNTTNGAVQTAAKEGNTSVLMRNVIDSNGGPEGVHYAIDDFVTLKPEQMKLADITYDDAGNLIPLSERFNWRNRDIRYSWLPWAVGGSTLGTAYGTFQQPKAFGGPLVELATNNNVYSDGGGLLDWLKSLFISEPETKYKASDGSVYSTKQEALDRNKQLLKEGKYYYRKGNTKTGTKGKMVPRKPNESPTSEKSMILENAMYSYLDKNRQRVDYRTKAYDIPYGEREIEIKPKGSPFSRKVSVNALDSVAKYAGITGLDIKDALGLAWQETKFGRVPVFNDGKMPAGFTDRELENSNYFRNFGSIPAEYLVRDFRYNGDLLIKGKRDEPISLSTPPLQHAFKFFQAGKYNPSDPNHTPDVKASGNAFWNETTGNLMDWWSNEGKIWYNNPDGPKKK